MRSGYNVSWTNEAIIQLDLIVDYLQNNWAEKEINKFFKKLEKRIELISRNPHAFPVVDKRINIRKSVLSEQTSIYYEIKPDIVVILTLFDNRKDPESLTL
jgi:plasmid stabilization system protein ParE